MAADTTIEWATKTWNPLLGCERVTSGCDNCYAINTATIRAGNPHPKVAAAFAGLTERRNGRLDWTGRINLLPNRLTDPLGWKKPQRIFVNSQSDLFHKDVPDHFIAKVFAVMSVAAHHTFQVLTKRHARMRSLLSSPDFHRLVADTAPLYAAGNPDLAQNNVLATWPLRNAWLGVSVEDQKTADMRIPALLGTPAAVRWLSMEPLLGSVDLARWVACNCPAIGNPAFCHHRGCPIRDGRGIGWAVVGGESGTKARPMHPDWARSLRDQCTDAGIPYFFKQWGEWAPNGWRGIGNTNPRELLAGEPDGTGHREVIERLGKKTAGRQLDGRTWDEYPAAREAVSA